MENCFTKREVYIDVSIKDGKAVDFYTCSALIYPDGSEPKVDEKIVSVQDGKDLVTEFTSDFYDYIESDTPCIIFATNIYEVGNYLYTKAVDAILSPYETVRERDALIAKINDIKLIDCISMSRVRSVTYFDDIPYVPREYRNRAKLKYHEAISYAKNEKDSFLFLQVMPRRGDIFTPKAVGAMLCDRSFKKIKAFFDDDTSESQLVKHFADFLQEKEYYFDVYADLSFPLEHKIFAKLNQFLMFNEPPYIFDIKSMMFAIGKDFDEEMDIEHILGNDVSCEEPLAGVEFLIRLYQSFLTKPIDIKMGRPSTLVPNVYSTHTYFLPFGWQSDIDFEKGREGVSSEATWLQKYLIDGNPAWECVSFDENSWQDGKTVAEASEMYAVYQTLNSKAFNLVFGGTEEKKFTTPVRNYRLRLDSGKKNTLTLKRGLETFYLKVTGVNLKVLRAGLAILSIDVENRHYSSVNDVNKIADYGRILNPLYVPLNGDDSEFAENIDMMIFLEGEDKPRHFTTDFYSEIINRVRRRERASLTFFPEFLTELLFDHHRKSHLLMKPYVENSMYVFTAFRNSRLLSSDIREWSAYNEHGVWCAGDDNSFAICREYDTTSDYAAKRISDIICKELYNLVVLQDVLLKRLEQEMYNISFGKEMTSESKKKSEKERKEMNEKYLAYKNQLFVEEPVQSQELLSIYARMRETKGIAEKEKRYLNLIGRII
ncbi:MAG: hypothetical protein MJ113_08010 [Lachnospiraceae bacterium]|nr:hypothetical protein [Lachnospiraceae bacterium]